jgi:hypothetical protein
MNHLLHRVSAVIFDSIAEKTQYGLKDTQKGILLKILNSINSMCYMAKRSGMFLDTI